MTAFAVLLALLFSLSWANECILRVARHYNIHPHFFYALLKVESGFHPYAVHYRGKSYYFRSKESALRFVSRLWERGERFDVGIGQINSDNLRAWGISPEEALDPCTNVWLAGKVLSFCMRKYGRSFRAIVCMRKYGRSFRAIDCYNRGASAKGRSRYVRKVMKTFAEVYRR